MIPKLEIFTIERANGNESGVRARWMRVTRAGHLVLWSWPWKRKAIYRDGTWFGVVRGVEPLVLEGAK